MKYGLSDAQLDEIVAFIKAQPEVEEAILFGSRALGTYKEASDIDIALKGERVTAGLAAKMKFDLEEDSFLPFFFDFVAFPTIDNDELVKHIDTKGRVIFRREGEWTEVSLDQVAEINPTESIKKGALATKVSMDVLKPFTKRPTSFVQEPFNGGMKFRNGDTIVARITPCLENGKTAYIDLLNENEVAYGSTEYIVLREKQGVSDKQFLYYFAISPNFRDVAILSMTGSSGRQRVQTDVVKKHLFDLPLLPEQRAIAAVLTSLDDKIDLLHRQNKTLEAMAETLFRQWFVEEAGEDWEECALKDIVLVVDNRGKTPPYLDIKTSHPIIEVNALTSNERAVNYSAIRKYVTDETFNTWFRKHLQSTDVLISTVGSIGSFGMFFNGGACIAQNIIGLRAISQISNFYLYQWLVNQKEQIQELDIGSVQPSIKVPHLLSLKLAIPSRDKINLFDEQVLTWVNKIRVNVEQIQTIETLRDTLLPKLMSGEVRVNGNG
ncbi:MAG: restriction endonuclease subunit S [Aquirhabdus sp.]